MNNIEYVFNEAITISEKNKYKDVYKHFIEELDKNIKKQCMRLLPKKYEYQYRGILYNLAKKFKNTMITNIKVNKIYYLDDKIDIDVEIFSLSSGIYTKNYVIDLELPW